MRNSKLVLITLLSGAILFNSCAVPTNCGGRGHRKKAFGYKISYQEKINELKKYKTQDKEYIVIGSDYRSQDFN